MTRTDHACSFDVEEGVEPPQSAAEALPDVPAALPSAPPTSADISDEEAPSSDARESTEATRGYRAIAKGVVVSFLACFLYVIMRSDPEHAPPRAASRVADDVELVSIPIVRIPPASTPACPSGMCR